MYISVLYIWYMVCFVVASTYLLSQYSQVSKKLFWILFIASGVSSLVLFPLYEYLLYLVIAFFDLTKSLDSFYLGVILFPLVFPLFVSSILYLFIKKIHGHKKLHIYMIIFLATTVFIFIAGTVMFTCSGDA